MGVPLHFWAEPTFRSIGKALGEVKSGADWVDSDNGRVEVIINGFQPLCFQTEIEFFIGEEVPITLRYERLFGYCHRCFSLCHDERNCRPNGVNGDDDRGPPQEPEEGPQNMSYKGAVDNGSHRVKSGDKVYQEEKRMGKRLMAEQRDGHDNNGHVREERNHRQYGNTRVGGEYGQRQRLPSQGRRNGQYHRSGRNVADEKAHAAEEKDHDREEGQCSEVRKPVTAVNIEFKSDRGEGHSGPKARKSLFQEQIGDGQQCMETDGGEVEAVILSNDHMAEERVEPMVENDKKDSGEEVLMEDLEGKTDFGDDVGDMVVENKVEDQSLMLPDGE